MESQSASIDRIVHCGNLSESQLVECLRITSGFIESMKERKPRLLIMDEGRSAGVADTSKIPSYRPRENAG